MLKLEYVAGQFTSGGETGDLAILKELPFVLKKHKQNTRRVAENCSLPPFGIFRY